MFPSGAGEQSTRADVSSSPTGTCQRTDGCSVECSIEMPLPAQDQSTRYAMASKYGDDGLGSRYFFGRRGSGGDELFDDGGVVTLGITATEGAMDGSAQRLTAEIVGRLRRGSVSQ